MFRTTVEDISDEEFETIVSPFDDFLDEYVKEKSGVDNFYEPQNTELNYFSYLFGQIQNTKEKSEAEVLVDLMNQLGSGVPMYYGNVYGE